MNTAKKLTLGLLRGSGATDPSASFTVTTTGAQTLTIAVLTVSAATTVDWGDGSSNAYTGSGSRTHNYAGAGTWTVRIMEPQFVTNIAWLNQSIVACAVGTFAKLIAATSIGITNCPNLAVNGTEIVPLASGSGVLTSFRISLAPSVSIAAGTIQQMTGLNNLTLSTVSGVTVNADETGYLTNLTLLELVGSANIAFQTGLAALDKLAIFRYENNLTTAQVDNVLSQLWAGFAARTVASGSIDLLGTGNLGPTGPVAAENPPTYGGAYVHELVNDTGNVNPTHKWLSASTATPV